MVWPVLIAMMFMIVYDGFAMFVIDEDKDDDNSRVDDDGVNTSEARIGPGGVKTTHAMLLLMISSYTWTVRNMIMLKCRMLLVIVGNDVTENEKIQLSLLVSSTF